MAILNSEIALYLNGLPVSSGQAIFNPGNIGQAADYVLVELHNRNASLTLSSPVIWLTVDAAGGAFSVAVADGTPRALAYTYAPVSASGLAYSSPTTKASGIAISALGPMQKILLAFKSDLSTGTQAHPESNILNFAGTSPI